jgi:predicted DNA-binding transcriptional regulator AlpA
LEDLLAAGIRAGSDPEMLAAVLCRSHDLVRTLALRAQSRVAASDQSLKGLIQAIVALAAKADQQAHVAEKQHEAFQRPARYEILPLEITRHRIFETAEAASFCGFSVPHWRRLYRSGKVPKPVQLSTRKLGWRAGDLIDWLQARLDSS